MLTMQAVIILACREHAGSMVAMLDNTDINDWAVMPAIQARRRGFLENMPGRHPHDCCVIYGCAERHAMMRALEALGQAQSSGSICTECVVHTWEVHQALLANVALDAVCEAVVDCEHALNAAYKDKVYYFCSEACRESFLKCPDHYVHRRQMKHRIDRRDVIRDQNLAEVAPPEVASIGLSPLEATH